MIDPQDINGLGFLLALALLIIMLVTALLGTGPAITQAEELAYRILINGAP